MTYEEHLKLIGLELLQPLGLTKEHHLMKCLNCAYEWRATPVSKVQAFKLYGHNGCPQCRKNLRYGKKHDENIASISEKFDILSEYDGSDNTTTKITVRNKDCSHTFEAAPGNLLHKGTSCPICNKQEKIKRLNANSKARSVEWQKTADIWDRYRHKVYMATRSTYHKHKSTINPNNLPRGKAGQEGAYHLDHIVPVRWCFEHYVPIEICAHHTNLQMLGWTDNVGSRDNLKEGVEIPEILVPYTTRQ